MHTKHHLQINNEKIVYYEYATDKPIKSIVIFCHGFPGGNRLTTMAESLIDSGVLLIEANYRGDEGCEGKFSFFGSMDDIEALTNNLKQQYINVPITALGFSAGGFFLCCIARKQPDLFDKIVLLNPLLDVAFTRTPIMEVLWEEARQSLSLHDMDFYNDEIEKMHQEYNPIIFAPEIIPKINIVQSSNDEVLSPDTVREFYDKLPNPGELVWIKGAGHGLRGDEPEIINTLTANLL